MMINVKYIPTFVLKITYSTALWNRLIFIYYSLKLCSMWQHYCFFLGISRDHWHKRRATGGKRKPLRKKRKFELGRPAANTKLGPRRVHYVRTRGGNIKYRALRLDTGNFAWGSEGTTRKTRIIDVVYNASNNELVRTKTLVKNAIVVIDATPFRQWYEGHYILPLVRKKGAKLVSFLFLF